MDEERAAKAARAKAMLKKHQKKKVAGPSVSSPLAQHSEFTHFGPQSSVASSPAPSELHEEDRSEIGDARPRSPFARAAHPNVPPAEEGNFFVPADDNLVQTQQQTISLLVAEKASLAASLERLEGVDQRSRETEELLAQKEQDIEGLNSRIAMLEDDVRSSSDMVSELLTTQREEVEKRRALERELELSKHAANEMRMQLQKQQTRVRELQEQIQQDDRVETLQKSLKGTQDRAESLEFQLSKLKQTHSKTKGERDSYEVQAQDAMKTQKDWEDKHTSLLKAHAQAQNELLSLKSERDSLQSRTGSLEEDLSNHHRSLTDLQQKLSQAASDLVANSRQLQSSQNELATLQRRAEDAEKAQAGLQSENVELMSSLNEMRPKVVQLTLDKVDLGETVERLQTTIRNQDGNIAELETLLQEGRAQLDQNGVLWKARQAEWEQGKVALSSDHGDLQVAYSKLEVELASAHAGVKELNSERGSHRQAVERYENELSRLRVQAEERSKELNAALRELDERKGAADEIESLWKEDRSELQSLRAELASRQEEILQLKYQSRSGSGNRTPTDVGVNTSLDAEMLNAMQQQHDLDLSAARSEIRRLETIVHEEQAKSHSLQRQITSLEDELANHRLSNGHGLARMSSPKPSSSLRRTLAENASPRRSLDLSRSFYPPPRPGSPSFLVSPSLTRATIDSTLPAETIHKRMVSLSMLKARIDSERAVSGDGSAHGASKLGSVGEERPDSRASLHSHKHSHPVKRRPQFGDESHVFWCHACSGDLVIL